MRPSSHLEQRYRERVRPDLSYADVREHLLDRMEVEGALSTARPEWVDAADASAHVDAYVTLGSDAVLLLRHDDDELAEYVAVTCLFRRGGDLSKAHARAREVAPLGDHTDARALIAALERILPGRRRDVADLLGEHRGEIERMRAAAQPVPAPRRLVLVALLVGQLRHAWTPEGIVAWFDRPRAELDNLTPRDLLDDETRTKQLVDLARASREQQAT